MYLDQGAYLTCCFRRPWVELLFHELLRASSQLLLRDVEELPQRTLLLKRNKYVGILSIAVTTLQYITISMITIFSMYIAHVR